MKHLTMDELEAGLDEIKQAPKNNGRLEMIVIRPEVDGRLSLQEGELTVDGGLVGDNWLTKGTSKTPNHTPHPDAQITLANSRVVQLYAQERERWPLAGDQLFVDFDLSNENLAAGDRLQIGTAVLEVTALPHNGCLKFAQRFGHPAHKFVNVPAHRHLNLRGIYAKVVQNGIIHTGDTIKILP